MAPEDARRGDDRSYERIDDVTLERLGKIAAADRARFFEGRPEYRDRLICVALCQGAGQHYVDLARGRRPPNGVKDLDVWSFFSSIPGERFPAYRRSTNADFGPSKFGRWPGEPPKFRHFKGRRVDLFMRDLNATVGANPVEALGRWLGESRTDSQQLLAAKGVVLIEPSRLRGTIVWDGREP